MHKPFYIPLFTLLFFTSCGETSSDNGKLKEMPVERPAKKNEKLVSGNVIGITDGDTFKMLAEGNRTIKVRLYGVDAPEKGQDYGTQARQKLSDLIFSKSVVVEQKNTDRYGRLVGVAYIDGRSVNEELLKSGYVWHYTEYDKNKEWAKLQHVAQQRKAGLWSKANPTAPWQWRRVKRKAQAVEP